MTTASPDAYISFRGPQQRSFGEADRGAALLFVDLDSDQVDALRAIPRPLTLHPRLTVVLRAAEPTTDITELLAKTSPDLVAWRPQTVVLGLRQTPGAAPVVIDSQGNAVHNSAELAARARAIELEALIDFGQARWQPEKFHYRLVTGRHAGTFIKLGDALRSPRDAHVLATWLLEHVNEDTGMVIDTGTLTPIAQALALLAAQFHIKLARALVLDALPRGERSVWATIDQAAANDDRLLVVIGVSSSGQLRDRVLMALAAKGSSLRDPQVVVMVSRDSGLSDTTRYRAWTPIGSADALLPPDNYDDLGCQLCRDPSRAPLIPINPFTFDAMGPNQLKPTVPSTKDPERNRHLWEAADRQNAVFVEQAAVEQMRQHRSDRTPMGVKFEMAKIVADVPFRVELKRRIANAQAEYQLGSAADLVLVPEHELKDELHELWNEIGPSLAPSVEPEDLVAYPTEKDFPKELIERVKSASAVLVFALGTVTGTSLQRALVEVQTAKTGLSPDFDLQGLVVHARPATHAELRSIRNSYGRKKANEQLHVLWTSVLPDRSPVKEEYRYLTRFDLRADDGLAEETLAFITERLELGGRTVANAEDPTATRLLWGSAKDTRLSPNAIYGQNLGPVATYAAVGSAMSAALTGKSGVPELVQFEVARLARSYYDPLILCCFLRWMRPHEAFWGWNATEAEDTAGLILNRSDRKHRRLLVPEMLLAGAQGKLAEEALAVVVEAAENMRDQDEWADVRPAVDAGLRLVAAVRKVEPPTPAGGAPAPLSPAASAPATASAPTPASGALPIAGTSAPEPAGPPEGGLQT